MKILFITKHNPFGIGGGSFASLAYLKAFSEISSGNIDVCLANTVKVSYEINHQHIYHVKERSFINRLLSVFSGEMHRYSLYVKRLLINIHNYDYCVFDHSSIAGTLVDYVNKLGITTITIHHNYEPDYFKSSTSNYIIKQLFLPIVRRQEKRAYLNSKINFFLTSDDFIRFNKEYGNNNVINKVIGCFECSIGTGNHHISLQKYVHKSPIFIISGSLLSNQNIITIKHFFEKYYPLLPKESTLIITGKQPTIEIERLCARYTNVELIPDPINMLDIIKKADIYICPIEIGGGLKLRIMDGLKCGLPVLAHRKAARGYEMFFDKEWFRIYDDVTSFFTAMDSLIKTVYTNDSNKIIEDYFNFFSFDNGKHRIESVLKKC
jgi:hypothetical protein